MLIGDLQGRVTGVPLLHIDVDKIRYGKSISLWNEEDNVKVEFMNVMVIEKYLYFVVVRADCLYIFLTNKNGKLIDSSTFHVGNLNITGKKIIYGVFLVRTNRLIKVDLVHLQTSFNIYFKSISKGGLNHLT